MEAPGQLPSLPSPKSGAAINGNAPDYISSMFKPVGEVHSRTTRQTCKNDLYLCSDFDYIRMDMSEQHANVRDSPSHTVT